MELIDSISENGKMNSDNSLKFRYLRQIMAISKLIAIAHNFSLYNSKGIRLPGSSVLDGNVDIESATEAISFLAQWLYLETTEQPQKSK